MISGGGSGSQSGGNNKQDDSGNDHDRIKKLADKIVEWEEEQVFGKEIVEEFIKFMSAEEGKDEKTEAELNRNEIPKFLSQKLYKSGRNRLNQPNTKNSE